MDSPVGPLLLAADDEGLRLISYQKGKHAQPPESGWKKDAAPLRETIRQLKGYFGGELHDFDLRLAPQGTEFQTKVWSALCDIPYGETISYGDLARRIRNPKAVRAVGTANGANPISIVIPCHRVIGSDGTLTGYGGGLDIKEKLLALEQKQMRLL
jgi:methylated-DNA-[protein]-cysteine S-methyltransferase